MTMPELIVSLNKRIIEDGKRIAELAAENKKAVYGCCEECGVIADLERAEAERDALRDWTSRAVHWLPWHEPSHPDYQGEKSDIGREGRELLSRWQPREGGEAPVE